MGHSAPVIRCRAAPSLTAAARPCPTAVNSDAVGAMSDFLEVVGSGHLASSRRSPDDKIPSMLETSFNVTEGNAVRVASLCCPPRYLNHSKMQNPSNREVHSVNIVCSVSDSVDTFWRVKEDPGCCSAQRALHNAGRGADRQATLKGIGTLQEACKHYQVMPRELLM